MIVTELSFSSLSKKQISGHKLSKNTRLRMKIFYRDKCRCQACGLQGNEIYLVGSSLKMYGTFFNSRIMFNIDHLIPLSSGGGGGNNLQTFCVECNSLKGNQNVSNKIIGRHINSIRYKMAQKFLVKELESKTNYVLKENFECYDLFDSSNEFSLLKDTKLTFLTKNISKNNISYEMKYQDTYVIIPAYLLIASGPQSEIHHMDLSKSAKIDKFEEEFDFPNIRENLSKTEEKFSDNFELTEDCIFIDKKNLLSAKKAKMKSSRILVPKSSKISCMQISVNSFRIKIAKLNLISRISKKLIQAVPSPVCV